LDKPVGYPALLHGLVHGLPVEAGSNDDFPSTRLKKMKMRNILALAVFGSLLAAAGCKGNNENAADSTGTSAMGDTAGMSGGTMGTTEAPTGAMTDSTGMTTGTMTDSATSMGDTIKR
jgi:hypothetical protein